MALWSTSGLWECILKSVSLGRAEKSQSLGLRTYEVVVEERTALAGPTLRGDLDGGLVAFGSNTREWGLIVVEVPFRKGALSPEIRAVGHAAGSIRLHSDLLIARTSLEICLVEMQAIPMVQGLGYSG